MQSRTRPVSDVRLVGVALLAAALNAPGPAPAQQPPAPLLEFPAPAPQLLLPHGGATLDRYFARLRLDFAQVDADVDGKITYRDVELHVLMESVRLRTFALQFVMFYDLDDDGAVTEDEIRRRTRRALTLKSKTKGEITWQDYEAAGEALFRKVDGDHDGKISPQELDDYRRAR